MTMARRLVRRVHTRCFGSLRGGFQKPTLFTIEHACRRTLRVTGLGKSSGSLPIGYPLATGLVPLSSYSRP